MHEGLNTTDSQLLALLEAIERNSKSSQRDIARLTGLNVAKVNFLIRRCVDKGHVKLQNITKSRSKLRYLYILTPNGVREKTRLTYSFMIRALREYNELEARLRKVLSEFDNERDCRVILYGITEITRFVAIIIEDMSSVSVEAIVDDYYEGKEFRGYKVLRTSEVDFNQVDKVVVCVPDAVDLVENEELGANRLLLLS